MPRIKINEVEIFYELKGEGDIPIVLVHGSWVSHQHWELIQASLGEKFKVLSYDRRGHSESERLQGQGSITEDVGDLAGLIERFKMNPALVIGHSFGAVISLRLAGVRPELIRGLILHEPPLFSLLADEPDFSPILEATQKKVKRVVELIKKGKNEDAAREFIEKIVSSPGAWTEIPGEMKKVLIYNAPTFLDEAQDPEKVVFKSDWVRSFSKPALLTYGEESPPHFVSVVRKLSKIIPGSEVQEITGAGHSPLRTHPEKYSEILKAFIFKHWG